MTSICITHRPSAVELVTHHIIANSTLLASITDEISFHRMTPSHFRVLEREHVVGRLGTKPDSKSRQPVCCRKAK